MRRTFRSTSVSDEHSAGGGQAAFFATVVPAAGICSTRLVRLKNRLGLRDLSPIHRIDRDTAGLVMFSVQRETRGKYQSLFPRSHGVQGVRSGGAMARRCAIPP